MSVMEKIEPVVKTLALNVSVEKAFHHFTANIHLWWPLAGHSLSQGEAQSVVFEARKSGRIYEIEKSGREREWGVVKICEAPNRLVFSWVLEAPEKATEIEVQFAEEGAGKSTLTLIHRGWENREDGAEWRENYNGGWDGVLALYAGSV
ncbi:SRPBCC domain-containing protein [Hyphococcus sp.]|uniref:SRPBCC domain-containing protein n=1 Tax=Hyphococcus sp. TaxID=2038636 RepID=UPI0035C6E987